MKEDVAEVLRRRFFDPESLKKRESWPQHVIAALKGIARSTSRPPSTERPPKIGPEELSIPPRPDRGLYAKWTAGIEGFQRTRGVLRTFALALREARKVGRARWSAQPRSCVVHSTGLSDAARELVVIADTIVTRARQLDGRHHGV